MRKTYISLICFLIIFTVICFAQGEERYPRIGFIKSDYTNIRAGDNLNFEVLCQVSRGNRVKVLEKRYKWFKVLLPKNACAFIKKEYVSSDDGIGIVNAHNVNVRAKPGTNFTIIGQLNKEDRIKIIEELEGWYRIQPKNFTGWIHSDLITFTPIEKIEAKSAAQEKKKGEATKEEIERVGAAAPAEKAEEFKPKELFMARGVLQGAGRVINRPGTHKLILGPKNFYYLKSNKVDLNSFINSNVEVKGKVLETKGDKPYLISVETIEVIK